MKSWILASVFAALPLQAQVVLEYVSDAAIPDGGGDVGLQYSVDVTVPFSQIADLNIALHVVPVDSEDAWNGDLFTSDKKDRCKKMFRWDADGNQLSIEGDASDLMYRIASPWATNRLIQMP